MASEVRREEIPTQASDENGCCRGRCHRATTAAAAFEDLTLSSRICIWNGYSCREQMKENDFVAFLKKYCRRFVESIAFVEG